MNDPLTSLLIEADWHSIELKRDRGGDYLQETETGIGITLAELVKRYNVLLRSAAGPAAPLVTDALIKAGVELHNIVDNDLSQMVGYEWACENWRKALSDYEKLSPTNTPQVISRVNFDTRETELIVSQAAAPAVGDVGAVLEAAKNFREWMRQYDGGGLSYTRPECQALIDAVDAHVSAVTALGKGGE